MRQYGTQHTVRSTQQLLARNATHRLAGEARGEAIRVIVHTLNASHLISLQRVKGRGTADGKRHETIDHLRPVHTKRGQLIPHRKTWWGRMNEGKESQR